MVCRSFIILCFTLCSLGVSAQTDSVRRYTPEHPLVYEDPLNIWPYSFLNEKGEPDGFNIDLFRLLMKELDIPYIIRLKPQHEVLKDLKDRKSDLTLGPTAEFYNKYSLYGRNTITILTQSVATPKGKPVKVKSFRDLSKDGLRVTVNDSSLCHHLMEDYGWGANAVPTSDMSETIREVSSVGQGMIVWNTVSLKWLIAHYHLDNLTLTPVNMPHGEYKYMSGDQHLLNLVDKAYSDLYVADKLTALEKKWFYPDREQATTPFWVWCLIVLGLLLIAVAGYYLAENQKQIKRLSETKKKLKGQLNQLSDKGKMRIWTYNVEGDTFTWYNEDGKAAGCYAAKDFAKRYSKEDYTQLKGAIDRIVGQEKDAKGREVIETTLELKGKDAECGDGELHYFVVMLSILSRDLDGKPSVIIASKKDVTKELRLKQLNNERSLRYWSVFYNDEAGVVLFDRDGYLQNANPKAGELFRCNIDKLVDQHVHISQFLHREFANLPGADGFRDTLIVGKDVVRYQLKTVCNSKEELLGLFVFCL